MDPILVSSMHEYLHKDVNPRHQGSPHKWKYYQFGLAREKRGKICYEAAPKCDQQYSNHLEQVGHIHKLQEESMQTIESNQPSIIDVPIAPRSHNVIGGVIFLVIGVENFS